jgi:hypothetical protein
LSDIARREFGWQGVFEEIRSFDLSVSFNLDPRELEELMRLAHEPDRLLGLAAVPGSVEGLMSLAGLGFEIAVVTGRPSSAREPSRGWLQRQGVPFSRLLFVDKYSRATADDKRGGTVSLDELRAMPFDLAIEDAPTMLTFLARETPLAVIAFGRPWNERYIDEHPEFVSRVSRCVGWDAVLRRVQALSLPVEAEPRGEEPDVHS